MRRPPISEPSSLIEPSDPAQSQVAPPATARRTRFTRIIRSLIATLHRWAESGWSGPAVAAWNTMQASFVPGPADALLAPLGLADPPRVWRLVSWAILGSMIGGVIAYASGMLAFDEVGAPVLRVFGVGESELAMLDRQFQRHGWLFIIISAITPISTKIVCIAAGAFSVPFPQFTLALLVGRSVRFLIVAALIRFAGERVNRWIARAAGPPSAS